MSEAGALPSQAPAELARRVRAVEAMLFVAGEPVTVERLRSALGLDAATMADTLTTLETVLVERGLCLQRHGETVQLVTAPDLAGEIERFLGLPAVQRLSHAALETLAVLAYRQPATRAQIETVRGVDSGGVIQTLLARALIEEVGRLPGPGHPALFATTPEFLRLFGLASLDELPALAAADGTPLAEVWERRLGQRALISPSP